MMKTLKELQTRIYILLLTIFVLISCNKSSNDTIYYNYYSENDSLKMYIIKNIDIKNNKRKEIDSFFSITGKLEHIKHNTFIVDEYSLNKVTSKTTRPYLTINSKDCIEYKLDNELAEFAQTNYCFIEITDIKINNINYSNVYKFIRTTGTIDGVQAIVYLDEEFIILKEEYLSGYRSYYKTERVDKINFIKN